MTYTTSPTITTSGVTVGHAAKFSNVKGEIEDAGGTISGNNTGDQVIASLLQFSSAAGVAATETKYVGQGFASATEAQASVPVASAITVSALLAKAATAPGGSDTLTFTLRKNAADTAVTCTITGSATTASDTTHSVTFAAGDLIDVKVVSSATAVTSYVSASAKIAI